MLGHILNISDFFEQMKPIQMTYPTTGVEETTLKLIGEKFSSPPENYKIHGGRHGCLKLLFIDFLTKML